MYLSVRPLEWEDHRAVTAPTFRATFSGLQRFSGLLPSPSRPSLNYSHLSVNKKDRKPWFHLQGVAKRTILELFRALQIS